MMELRKGSQRGHADFGWLDSRHTFSFGSYFDRRYMGVSSLRVINEDRVEPGRGFGTHPHRDMEIISYVVDGVLEHRDTLGTHGVIRPGEVQVMSAGTGVMHSEQNGSSEDPVHFLQIWVLPNAMGLPPRYDQKHFPDDAGPVTLVVSGDGRDGSLRVNQDVSLYRVRLEAGTKHTFTLPVSRMGYLQVVRGTIEVMDVPFSSGDGAAFDKEPEVVVSAATDAEFLFFDLP